MVDGISWGIEKSLYNYMREILSARVDGWADSTLTALKIWLRMYPDSGHPLDIERYNQFVKEAKAHKDKITGYILAEVLKQEKPSWCEEYLCSFVEEKNRGNKDGVRVIVRFLRLGACISSLA